MNPTHSLEENIQHGTQKEPIYIQRFYAGSASDIPDTFHVDRHWHHNLECLLIRKGTYQVELNLDTIPLREGDVCLINSGELHMLTSLSKEACHDAIVFPPQLLSFSYTDRIQEDMIAPLLSHTTVLPHVISQASPYYLQIFTCLSNIVNNWLTSCNAMTDSMQTIGVTDSYFYTKLHLLEMLHILYSHDALLATDTVISASEKEKIDRYKSIVSYMKANIQKKVTLEQLAEVAQCNPQYLCHFFKDFSSKTPIQYLISLRIDYAQTLLQDTTKSILEISLDCGFENVSYFIRQFKTHTGITPKEYRKKATSQ